MSFGDSSCATRPDICVGETTQDQRNDSECVNSEGHGPGGSERQRVLKEVGLTCSTFIGPALPPKPVTADIDGALSEFYKELGEVNTPGNPGPTAPKLSDTKDTHGVSRDRTANTSIADETDGCEIISGQKRSSWSHWYQNEPYNHRRPRPDFGRASYAQDQKPHPQPWNTAPIPRFHRPRAHCPAPSPEYMNPQNRLRNMNPEWNESDLSNYYSEDAHFSTFSVPPPNVGFVPHQGFYGHSEHFFDGCRGYDPPSDNVNERWARDAEEEWSQTQQYRSSFMLILMRGLPGSGKTTLARYMLVSSLVH